MLNLMAVGSAHLPGIYSQVRWIKNSKSRAFYHIRGLRAGIFVMSNIFHGPVFLQEAEFPDGNG
jgi:hypothetical protein